MPNDSAQFLVSWQESIKGAGTMVVIVISWVIISFIVAVLAEDREIGFGQALLICLFLSPLIGAIFVATSPKASATPPRPPEVEKLIISGDAKFSSGDLDAA